MSSYAGFPVQFRDRYGVITAAGAGVEVHVRAEGEVADEAESPLTTDADGEIAAGTLAGVAAGTLVHFRVENEDGVSRSISQITT